jgi:hypothetical protein
MEPKPTQPGTYYGQLSSQQEWFWAGTGQPDDAWIPSEAAALMEVEPSQEAPSQLVTSSSLQHDWIELYLTPVSGP